MSKFMYVTGKIGPAFRSTVSLSLEEFGQVEAIALNESATDSSNVLSSLIAATGRLATNVMVWDAKMYTEYVDFAR